MKKNEPKSSQIVKMNINGAGKISSTKKSSRKQLVESKPVSFMALGQNAGSGKSIEEGIETS